MPFARRKLIKFGIRDEWKRKEKGKPSRRMVPRNLLGEGRAAYRGAFFAQARSDATQTDQFFSGEPTGGIALFSPISRI